MGLFLSKILFSSFKLTMSILSLLPPFPLPINQFSNDGSGRFFWKKNEVRFGFLVNGG
jgi:hypothetical protein